MLQKIRHKLREKKGASTYIEIAILIVVCLMIFVFTLTYLQIFMVNNRLNMVASEVTRFIEIKGQVNSQTYAEFDRLKAAAKLDNARIEISANGKIPLERQFTVKVFATHSYGIGAIKLTQKEFHVEYSGRSEVYWK